MAKDSVKLVIIRSGVRFSPWTAEYQPWVSCSHLCASVTNQHNLVLVKGQCSTDMRHKEHNTQQRDS